MIWLLVLLSAVEMSAADWVVAVGSGSYTTRHPGLDAAGRNQYPGGSPQLSGAALGRSVPTNDWWSLVLKNDHAGNLFNYPLGMRTMARGLDIGYVVPGSGPNGSVQPLSDQSPVVVGVVGLNAARATVADYTDWTVKLGWQSGQLEFWATSGVAMPMVYFEKSTGSTARVEVNWGTVSIDGAQLLIQNSQGGANFAVYAPAGSEWQRTGNIYTSDLNGRDYWTLAKLPPGQAAAAAAAEMAAYAFAFPVETVASWDYDESTSVLRVDYRVETEAKEGTETRLPQGLLPHQWAWLGDASPQPGDKVYPTIRGQMRLLIGNHYYTERKFAGVLPTLPWIPGGSDRFSIRDLDRKIALIENDQLATWTDSYNEGQVMNRLIQTARVADLIGRHDARDKLLATVKERLEDWFTADPGEVAFLFYYHAPWTAIIGYPAGHGQDSNLNDHHFHWGYFIHAAAFIEQFEPGWAAHWGPMVAELIRDAANPRRDDPKYPFLRNFSPYAGHAWANGFATFPQGNDQESTSESMQFNTALIHWGSVIGDKEVRDLGIYLYVTEQSAIEEYWLDIHQRTFKPGYGYSLASRVWGNGYDNGTFWTSDIAAAYGIELYPIHGGSLYLGHHPEYVQRLWTEMAANTGILSNQANPNLWHDVYWSYLAFIDPQQALDLYASYPGRELKFGITDVQTYHWLHAMQALGRVEPAITADHPIAAVFRDGSRLTYVAHNYAAQQLRVTFSDGEVLDVPARSMATSRDVPIAATLTLDFALTEPGGSVGATVNVSGASATRVDFYLDDQFYQSVADAPYQVTITQLQAGVRSIYARVYHGDAFTYSNVVAVQVGRQRPYDGTAWPIPGIIEPGKYDRFAGAIGQGITYSDNSPGNAGTFRPEEFADSSIVGAEGAIIGWTEPGEWLEYTVDIAQSGVYSLSLRYASGNTHARGPIRLLINDRDVTGPIAIPATSGWSDYRTLSVGDIELIAGERVLRLEFTGGEVNLGRMTFHYSGPLTGDRPVANPGATRIVVLPTTQIQLDASASYVPDGRIGQFQWIQRYGPSMIQFSDVHSPNPVISGLVAGFYGLRLILADGIDEDQADLLLVVSAQEQIPPQVNITAPADLAVFPLGVPILLASAASDVDGSVQSVAFFSGDIRIGTAWSEPFSFEWTPYGEGAYVITAVATDDSGMSTASSPILVVVDPPRDCDGISPNGDFSYSFSRVGEDYFITFVPRVSGAGQNLCLLYYSTTGAGPFPGYGVSPNVPFRLNAQTGQMVTFYYTYSHPAGGERTTFGQPQTYTLAPCGPPPEITLQRFLQDWRSAHFHPDILNDHAAEATQWGKLADPDGDGYANIVEAFFAMDPHLPDAPPATLDINATGHPVWSILMPAATPADSFIVEVSFNLTDWSANLQHDSTPVGDPTRVLHQFTTPAPAAAAFFRFSIRP